MKTAVLSATRRDMLRRGVGLAVGLPAAWVIAHPSPATALPPVVVWKDPNCGCCDGWARHLRAAGFSVTVRATDAMAGIKQARGVPPSMQSCHTAVIDGYVIEGHVPAANIVRLLDERPPARGLAVPGMPASAPGMDQPGSPYTVMLFGGPDGERIFARHDG